MINPIRRALRNTIRRRRFSAYPIIFLFVIFASGVLAFGVESLVRNTFTSAEQTATGISAARRDLDIVRSTLNSQTRALLRFGRSGNAERLLEFRTAAFDDATARVETDMRAIGAGAAIYPLALARTTHQAWVGRVNRALARDVHALSPPGPEQKHIPAHGRRLFDDLEKTNTSIEANLDQIRLSLDTSERDLKDRMNRIVPRAISLTTFVGAMLVLVSLTALFFGRRYFLERMRTAALARAFAGGKLPAIAGVTLDGVLVPMPGSDIVGGDWYDARELPDGRVFITIGDVAGHGVSAAVIAANIRRSLLGAAIGTADPATVLKRVNREFLVETHATVGVLCAYYNPHSRDFSYASAGMPAPLVRERHRTRYLAYGGPPLGADADFEYERHAFIVEPDAHVLLYTDGIIEHSRDSLDGEAHLLACANGISGANYAQLLFKAIFLTTKQRDDVAILALSTANSTADYHARSDRSLRIIAGPFHHERT